MANELLDGDTGELLEYKEPRLSEGTEYIISK